MKISLEEMKDGEKAFEHFVLSIEKKSGRKLAISHLRPFIQTAQRLDYIFCMGVNNHSFFSEMEIPHVNVLKRFLWCFDKMSGEHKKELLSRTEGRESQQYSEQVYINEVNRIVSDVKWKFLTDSYSIRRTFFFLSEYITFYGKRWGLPKEMLFTETCIKT